MAVLVWIPLYVLLQADRNQWNTNGFKWIPLAGWLLALGLQMPPGGLAGMMSLPWLAISIHLAWAGLLASVKTPFYLPRFATGCAPVFLLIGALWASADRFGISPMGFDASIVRLTALHFHYAGFVCTLLGAWLADLQKVPLFRWATLLFLLGVPLTAAGITWNHLTQQYWLETSAALIVTGTGSVFAIGYLLLAFQTKRQPAVRRSAFLLGCCLVASMCLAICYALRPYYPLPWLDIPAMRAWHGSLNAMGVTGAGWLFGKALNVKVLEKA
ncbi:MAG: YndJ family transporter [Lewinellaceae bacterium]|nr:YndJ family transporter [Lewinellaceae bacterium]